MEDKNVTKIVPKNEEIITLIKFLNKYSLSEKYSSVIKNEKDASLKSLLIIYKESFLEDILRTEVLTYKEMSLEKDISIENPEVGDLLVAIGRLNSDHVEKFRSKIEKLESAFWFIAVFSILISLIVATNYKEPFFAQIVLLGTFFMILIPLRKRINTLDNEKD